MSQKLSNKQLISIANEFGTPVYVYHAEKIEEQFKKLKEAFKNSDSKFFYACKALTNINILKWMRQIGASLDCVSINEVMLGLRAGFEPHNILFTPNCVDFEEIEAGKIYIAPPDNHLLIKDGKVALRFGPAENRWRPSIDVLFRSAAAYHGNRVIGIILTGYLNDGTAGMSAIKKSNGYCIVQDPNQAEYPDMPISVLETMEVDYCVPLDKMGETILSIIQHAPPEIKVTQNEVLKEAQIAERTMTDIETVAQLGQQALYACPDCGGGLWDISGSEIKRFRCHIGHAYSEKDLLIKQEESIESTLWVALRMMEERKMLYKKISSDESNKGLLRLSISHEQKADELEEHILKLKSLLTDTQRDKTEK